jgi:endonuclease VIII
MPEGHTLHRLAADHAAHFGGRAVRCSSPQGRFADGAARLDGRELDAAEAYGKHIFYRWAGLGDALHVHLGLFGRFRFLDGEPGAGTRLVMEAGGRRAGLSGPTACELLDPDGEDTLRARLGPDPLRDDADPERAWAALRRRRIGIGAALLDQRVVAGIGNVVRAEALARVGLDPDRPARELDRDEFDALWSACTDLLVRGVRTGRLAPRRAVYRRAGEPCRRCGATVEAWELGGRRIYACRTCQPPT